MTLSELPDTQRFAPTIGCPGLQEKARSNSGMFTTRPDLSIAFTSRPGVYGNEVSGRSCVCAKAMQHEDATADTSMASLRMAAFREWPEDRRFNHKIPPAGVGSGGDSRLAIGGLNAPTAPCIRKRNRHTPE
jgi:hypothetical protein